MDLSWRRIAAILTLLVLGGSPAAVGDGPSPALAPGQARLPVPTGLPSYDIKARLNLESKTVTAVERVTFTNRTPNELASVVLHVYPRYKVAEQDKAILAKTLEFLRLAMNEEASTTVRNMTTHEAVIRRSA